MTFVITQPCIDTKDQACVEVCPVDCIHFDEGDDRMLYINPAECIDCGACQPACPVNAIFGEDDVPADQQPYIALNALWYDDASAARTQVGQLAGGGAAAPTEAAPAVSAAASATAPADGAAPADGDAAETPAAADAGDVAAEAAPEPEPVAVAAIEYHVEALGPEETVASGVILPEHRLPSPQGLLTAAIFAGLFFAMWTVPGPTWLEIGDVSVGATVVVGVPLAIIFALGFLVSQVRDLSAFSAASRVYVPDAWRQKTAIWRRSEENRRYELERVVGELAGARFNFPSDEHPDYRTHVNLPEPTMALEFGGGGNEKVFPDILVTSVAGNTAVMVAQLETRETVSREQAERVWARLESENAPLYLYVPAGTAGQAKRFAKAAGLRHVQFRTWRRQPFGMIVEEV